ncbi:MAG: homoserine dehydrogenase [Thermoprotei archaeon]|nr:MAG: homoserine dehydrogenase [Thermoprotei archaeon]
MKAIIVGFGFIGRSFAKAIREKLDTIRSLDPGFKLVGVADIEGYLLDPNGLDVDRLSLITRVSEYPGRLYEGNALELIEKSEADILVEATPTNVVDGQPGLSHIEKALSLGMHVVTSNKGPLVVAYRKLTELAKSKGVRLLFEATVAGAIPVFSLVKRCLRGDRIRRIYGILNGTTNYILSRMYFDDVSFEIALKEAQERGLAERDPSYDVEGIDAACKVVILANELMGMDVKLSEVKRVGITRINREAIKLAKKAGYAIKLIAYVGDRLEVTPRLVPLNHPICVHGTLNALHFETDLARELTLIGPGAGKETVSAMMNDLLSILGGEAR